jgi:hypothetical protein
LTYAELGRRSGPNPSRCRKAQRHTTIRRVGSSYWTRSVPVSRCAETSKRDKNALVRTIPVLQTVFTQSVLTPQSSGHQFGNLSLTRGSSLLCKLRQGIVPLAGQRREKGERMHWLVQIRSTQRHLRSLYLPTGRRKPVWKPIAHPRRFVAL